MARHRRYWRIQTADLGPVATRYICVIASVADLAASGCATPT